MIWRYQVCAASHTLQLLYTRDVTDIGVTVNHGKILDGEGYSLSCS